MLHKVSTHPAGSTPTYFCFYMHECWPRSWINNSHEHICVRRIFIQFLFTRPICWSIPYQVLFPKWPSSSNGTDSTTTNLVKWYHIAMILWIWFDRPINEYNVNLIMDLNQSERQHCLHFQFVDAVIPLVEY